MNQTKSDPCGQNARVSLLGSLLCVTKNLVPRGTEGTEITLVLVPRSECTLGAWPKSGGRQCRRGLEKFLSLTYITPVHNAPHLGLVWRFSFSL